MTDPKRPTKLLPQAEREAALKEFVETNHYVDTQTGELYEPTSPPELADSHDDDEDSDGTVHLAGT